MAVIQWDVIVGAGGTCLASADKSLDGQDVTSVHITVLLLAKVLAYFSVFVLDDIVSVVVEQLVESVDEVQETYHFFITHGNVSARLVSYMYVVPLFYQATDSATHRDNIIIGMGREYNDALGVRSGTFGTIRIVSVRFAARPSGNGVLQVIEYFDIDIIGRPVKSQQFAQSVFVVILVRQFQDGLPGELAQPYNGTSYQFVVPFT